MGNDNTLDDLILTEPEPEKSKSRGLLALLGLVILLIIVGALLAKMIFSTPKESKKDENTQKVEVKSDINSNLDNITNNQESKKDSAVASLTNTDPDLAPISDMSMNTNMDTVNIDESKDGEAKNSNTNDNEIALKGDSTKVANSEDSLGVAPVSNNIQKEETPPKRVVVKERVAKERTIKHTKQKERVVQNKKRTTKTYGGRGSVYIQVGSFTKGPEQSFIRKITRAGFKYRIKTQNGYRRVYVGPFESRSEAAKYLGRVRSQINPQAFIK